MPSVNNASKLMRSNAVWDLTSIPADAPLYLNLRLEIHSSESPITLRWESSSLVKVKQLRKYISGLIPHQFVLKSHDQVMSDWDYLYEYCMKENDVIKVICEE